MFMFMSASADPTGSADLITPIAEGSPVVRNATSRCRVVGGNRFLSRNYHGSFRGGHIFYEEKSELPWYIEGGFFLACLLF